MMDIYQHFSCFTNLPIKIDHVADFLIERGCADYVYFCEVDIDPEVLWAQFRAYKYTPPYGDEKIVYEVHYSKHLTEEQRRLACCKELLHILDTEATMAATQDSVEKLIQEMSIPPNAGISMPGMDDHTAVIRALLLLMPRDCLDVLKPAYERGEITASEIGKAAKLPVEFVRLTLMPFWQELVEKIK